MVLVRFAMGDSLMQRIIVTRLEKLEEGKLATKRMERT